MFIVPNIEWQAQPGAVAIVRHKDTGKVVGYNHSCPCGCGMWSWIRIDPQEGFPSWNVDSGDPSDPTTITLSPSIGIWPFEQGQYHWHGYLRNGEFVEC